MCLSMDGRKLHDPSQAAHAAFHPCLLRSPRRQHVTQRWSFHCGIFIKSCNAQLFSTCTDASFSFCRLLPWPPSHNALRCLQTPPPPQPAPSRCSGQLILEGLKQFKVFISSCYFSLAATVNSYSQHMNVLMTCCSPMGLFSLTMGGKKVMQFHLHISVSRISTSSEESNCPSSCPSKFQTPNNL